MIDHGIYWTKRCAWMKPGLERWCLLAMFVGKLFMKVIEILRTLLFICAITLVIGVLNQLRGPHMECFKLFWKCYSATTLMFVHMIELSCCRSTFLFASFGV